MRTYQEDFAGWAEDTARAIEEGDFTAIDRAALADEVRDMGKRERRQITSALRVLLLHLLKAKYQSSKHSRSWDLSIAEERRRIERYLQESPSLKTALDKAIANAYEDALFDAERETGLSLAAFPERCEWTPEDIFGR